MKEQFFIAASKDVLRHLDAASDRTGLSRGQTFEDFLTFVRCSLAGQTMEPEYLQTVAKGYDKGDVGSRGIDQIVEAFGTLVIAMEQTQQDVLGDIFTGAVCYGEHGQFFTPDSVCELMAKIVLADEIDETSKQVSDPACGSGRSLLSIGKDHPHWEFTGQDVDHRCVQMTAINLGLNGLRGWAVWQDTLALQCYRVYRIGLNLSGGVIREVPVEYSPFNYGMASKRSEAKPPSLTISDTPNGQATSFGTPNTQRELF